MAGVSRPRTWASLTPVAVLCNFIGFLRETSFLVRGEKTMRQTQHNKRRLPCRIARRRSLHSSSLNHIQAFQARAGSGWPPRRAVLCNFSFLLVVFRLSDRLTVLCNFSAPLIILVLRGASLSFAISALRSFPVVLKELTLLSALQSTKRMNPTTHDELTWIPHTEKSQ